MTNYKEFGTCFAVTGKVLSMLLAGVLIGACAGTAEVRHPAAKPAPVPAPPPAVAKPAAIAPVAQTTPAPRVRKSAPLSYVVKRGDTLWGIANRFLRDPWQWPEVWIVNDQIANPHRIYPGDVLQLVFVDGRPQVGFSGRSGRVERLSPRVRELPLDQAIPVIPIEAIRDFLQGPRLVTAEELAAAPYILAFDEEHIAGGAGTPVYVRNLEPQDEFVFSVVRKGQIYKDPDNGEVLGWEGLPIGDVEVTNFGSPSSAVLARTTREALIGDRLLPLEPEAFSENFYPRSPKSNIDGRIIAVLDASSQIGQYYIVTLNRGTVHGLETGHVLDILQSNRLVRDPYGKGSVALPELYAGQLLVFKVTDRVSFGLVTTAERSIHLLDRVEKPSVLRR